MQKITYIGRLGEIDIFVDPDWSEYIFGSIDGINGFNTDQQVHTYPNEDGCEIDNIVFNSRNITLNGFIDAGGCRTKMYRLRRKLACVINGKEKGILRYTNDSGSWETEVLPQQLMFGARSETILPFVVHFTAYKFYWRSVTIYSQPIASIVKLMRFKQSLPMRFGATEKQATLVNRGDIGADLQFTIVGEHINPMIVNHTTGEYFELKYSMEPDEVVTVTSNDFRVTSSLKGNLIGHIMPDSVFLKLATGQNKLEYQTDGMGHDLSVRAMWREHFIGV